MRALLICNAVQGYTLLLFADISARAAAPPPAGALTSF